MDHTGARAVTPVPALGRRRLLSHWSRAPLHCLLRFITNPLRARYLHIKAISPTVHLRMSLRDMLCHLHEGLSFLLWSQWIIAMLRD
jgi:hypothetical protein